MGKNKALVTGGCGFVGRHFVKWLLNHNYTVIIVDDLSTGLPLEKWPHHVSIPETMMSDVTFRHMDFRKFAGIEDSRYDLIVHLAAVVGGRMTIEGDPLKVATDLAVDSVFFNWISKSDIPPEHILYFSSSAVYPICDQTRERHLALHESMVDFNSESIGIPDMTYGWSKLSGEFLARYAVDQYGLNVSVYRPFSGYGEDQDFTYPFPSIIRRVGSKENPVVVWGSGNQVRDFIHIDDVVEAVFASLDVLKPGEALNLGSGVGTSFRELAETACQVIGHDARIVNDDTKPEGVFARYGDCSKMLSFYTPRISLEEGIEKVHYYQKINGLL